MLSTHCICVLFVVQEGTPDVAWSVQLRFLDFLWIWRYEVLAFAAGVTILAFCSVRLVLWRKSETPHPLVRPARRAPSSSSEANTLSPCGRGTALHTADFK
jgi:hypothetical protein